MFQFLMVRLEARGTIIPAASTTVSIPYGSIRRGNFGQDSELLILFQFLMVRLEVAWVELLQRVIAVSIPYGSIRRVFED